MTVRVKIVMTAVNMVCLIFTLLQPNRATPIALLPVIVTACAWLFKSSDRNAKNKRRKSYYVLLCFALALASTCCILVFFSRPIQCSQSIGDVAIAFDPEVFLLGNHYIDYLYFVVVSLVIISALYAGEILQSIHSEPPPAPVLHSFNDEVMMKIEAKW